MSTSENPEQSTALPVIFELSPAGTFLPAKVRCEALDRRARQLPTALLAIHERLGVTRARYVRKNGTESIVVFDGRSYRFEAPTPITLQSYTVSGVAQYLCPICAAQTPDKAKWSGELINGYCDGCGAGPSVPAWQSLPATDMPAPTPELNALGEPMPKDQSEALARQLLAELNQLATFSTQALAVGERYTGEGDDLDTAYARKRAQLEALGYAVTAGSETGWRLALVEVEQQPAPEPAALADEAQMLFSRLSALYQEANAAHEARAGRIWHIALRAAHRADRRRRALAGLVCPTCGSDGSPCVDCNPIDEPPAELRPILDAFAAAWDARAESLARVAQALAPEPLVEQLPAGCRVRVTFGPDAGHVGTVVSGPSPDGYYSVTIDGREPDGWGSLWFFLGHEITLTTMPPAEDRPWANDAAYAAEGQRIG